MEIYAWLVTAGLIMAVVYIGRILGELALAEHTIEHQDGSIRHLTLTNAMEKSALVAAGQEGCRLDRRLREAYEYIDHLEHELIGYERNLHERTLKCITAERSREHDHQYRDRCADTSTIQGGGLHPPGTPLPEVP